MSDLGITKCLQTVVKEINDVLIDDLMSEIAELQKENDKIKKEYNKILDSLSECEGKRCKVIEEKREMRIEIERMRTRLKKEEKVVDFYAISFGGKRALQRQRERNDSF